MNKGPLQRAVLWCHQRIEDIVVVILMIGMMVVLSLNNVTQRICESPLVSLCYASIATMAVISSNLLINYSLAGNGRYRRINEWCRPSTVFLISCAVALLTTMLESWAVCSR